MSASPARTRATARPLLRSLIAGAAALLMAAPFVPAAHAQTNDAPSATIRRTTNGIPHILADDWEGLGYGYGYAFAQDNICTAADFYVTVAGERSKYFGPDATWRFHGNSSTYNNLDSDFFYKKVNASGRIEEILSMAPPHGPRPELVEGVAGYVAGYNQYLAEVGGPDGISDPRCQGAGWVRPITAIDAWRRFYQLASLASTGVAVAEIGSAQPPTPSAPFPSSGKTAEALLQENATELDERLGIELGIGSNAYGLGKEVTANGRGMVLGNPHFPWQEGERLYQSHLTIPGRVNVSGASLYGVPIILIGHTDGLAWSHTVSTARRFAIYEVQLVPGAPTKYRVDGEIKDMIPTEVTVEVKQDDGSITEETRTLYSTEYGHVLNGIVGLPIFPWTPERAFTIFDANDHMRYLNHFFEKNQAQTVEELFEVIKRNLGIPWVNTMAADKDGRTLYSDVSVVPHIDDAKTQVCSTPVGQAAQSLRVWVLDGSRSDCAPGTDDDAPAPGIFGPQNLPHLFRDDFISNMNDSYWLTNPAEPIEGFDAIIGDERAARTLRTRLGLRILEDRASGADGMAGTKWTQPQLMDAVFNNRQYAAELVRDDVVEMCRQQGGFAPNSSGGFTALGDACDILENWDLRDDLDSPGAILFRRFWTHADDASPSPWVNGFDVNDPVNTPNTLNTENAQVREALGTAVEDLNAAGIPLDGTLRDFQYEERGVRIPIHGGPGTLGVFNAISASWDPAAGYNDIYHGSSFVMVVNFTDGPCPDANAIVTYSQSEDVTSPYYNDQTLMYSRKEWNDMHFCESEIAADPNLTVQVLDAAATSAPAAAADDALPATGGGLVAMGLALMALAGASWGRSRRAVA